IKEWMPQIEAQLAHLNQQQEAIQKVLAAAPTAQLTTVSALVEKEPVTSQPGEPSTTSALPVVLTPAATPTFTVYHAAPTETLWRIAQRFYGKGNYYPVLLEDNPGLTIHGSPDSRNLRIASQLEHVKEIYQRLVFSEDGRILFRYQARVGDSWRSLARDFYGNERRTNELTKLHGLSQPEPGQRLAIPLD
ncbi:MAG: LysM peptidoglycan-binding domain-containing protein, partial [Sedimenticola sp.]